MKNSMNNPNAHGLQPPFEFDDFSNPPVFIMMNHVKNVMKHHKSACFCSPQLLGGSKKHIIVFSKTLGIIIPTDFHILQRGGSSTNQIKLQRRNDDQQRYPVFAARCCAIFMEGRGGTAKLPGPAGLEERDLLQGLINYVVRNSYNMNK